MNRLFALKIYKWINCKWLCSNTCRRTLLKKFTAGYKARRYSCAHKSLPKRANCLRLCSSGSAGIKEKLCVKKLQNGAKISERYIDRMGGLVLPGFVFILRGTANNTACFQNRQSNRFKKGVFCEKHCRFSKWVVLLAVTDRSWVYTVS